MRKFYILTSGYNLWESMQYLDEEEVAETLQDVFIETENTYEVEIDGMREGEDYEFEVRLKDSGEWIGFRGNSDVYVY